MPLLPVPSMNINVLRMRSITVPTYCRCSVLLYHSILSPFYCFALHCKAYHLVLLAFAWDSSESGINKRAGKHQDDLFVKLAYFLR